VESTILHHYWDKHGRKHVRKDAADMNNDSTNGVEKALNAIKRAATNIQAYKLNLKVNARFAFLLMSLNISGHVISIILILSLYQPS
jgi:hypothetical protein